MAKEPISLAQIFAETFAFLASRTDAVVFGAHAVNAYCSPERMTADVDVLSTDAASLAEALRAHLAQTCSIAVRVREVVPGGFRVYQIRDPKNRHLVDVRQTAELPDARIVEGLRVVDATELVAMKTLSMVARKGREKGLSDRLDLHRLLRAFPGLRQVDGVISSRLRERGAADDVLAAWAEIVIAPLASDDDETEAES